MMVSLMMVEVVMTTRRRRMMMMMTMAADLGRIDRGAGPQENREHHGNLASEYGLK